MYTISITTNVKQDGKDYENKKTLYEQTLEGLDIAAVIAVVNGLQKPASKVEEPQVKQ
jgi:hypothetical protein